MSRKSKGTKMPQDNKPKVEAKPVAPAPTSPAIKNPFDTPAIYGNQVMYSQLGSNVRLTIIEQIGGESFGRGAVVLPTDVAMALANLIASNVAQLQQQAQAAAQAAQEQPPPPEMQN